MNSHRFVPAMIIVAVVVGTLAPAAMGQGNDSTVGALRNVGQIGARNVANVGTVGGGRTLAPQAAGGLSLRGGGGGGGYSGGFGAGAQFTNSGLSGRRGAAPQRGTLQLSSFQMTGSVSNRLIAQSLLGEEVQAPQLPGTSTMQMSSLGQTVFDRSYRYARTLDRVGRAFTASPVTLSPVLAEGAIADEETSDLDPVSVPTETGQIRIRPVQSEQVDIQTLIHRSTEDYLSRAINTGFGERVWPRAQLNFDAYRSMAPQDLRGYTGACLTALKLQNRHLAMELWSQAMKRFAARNASLDELWFDFDRYASNPGTARQHAIAMCEELRKDLDVFKTGGDSGRSRVLALAAWVTWQAGDRASALEKMRAAAAEDVKKPVAERLPGIALLMQRMQQSAPDVQVPQAEAPPDPFG